MITGLRPHKALDDISISNKKTEKKDKELAQLTTLYLNNLQNLTFLVIPITDSQFYIDKPTPFDILIQKQKNNYEVISTELYDLEQQDHDTLVKDFDSKKSTLASMFVIKIKGQDKVDIKNINKITKVNVLKLGNFYLDNIEDEKNKQINLEEYFNQNKIGEIEIE